MRTVVLIEDEGVKVLELNWLWLPTCFGMNTELRKEIGKKLSSSVVGLAITEANLDKIDRMVQDFLVQKFPAFKGLSDYLDALKFVEQA